MLFFIHCFGIELVLCNLFLTRFDLTKDLIFDNFFIAVLKHSVVVITECLNSNHLQYQRIGKPKKTLKSNAPQTRFLNVKKSGGGKIFCGKTAPQAKLNIENE